MYNDKHKPARELWAITNSDGEILWSRGGSSSSPKLMVYDNEKSPERALKNSWIKHVYNVDELEIRKIYSI